MGLPSLIFLRRQGGAKKLNRSVNHSTPPKTFDRELSASKLQNTPPSLKSNGHATVELINKQALSFLSTILHQPATMISAGKLMGMAKKWQKMAGIGRRRKMCLPRDRKSSSGGGGGGGRLAEKGHFVVYSIDKRRFMVPLGYLSSNIFVEVLRMSEEEFGLPTDGPITLPFDAAAIHYMLSILSRHASHDLEEALLLSLCSASSSPSVHGGLTPTFILQGLRSNC